MQASEIGKSRLGINNKLSIANLVGGHTTQNQYDALLSLATDIGIDTFSKSTILKKHNARCYPCAQGQFMVWANKRPGDRWKRQQEREIYFYGYEEA